MLSSPSYPQVKDKLKATFPSTPKPDKAELQAPPLSKNRSLVGTAFDYAYRILLSVRLKDQPAIHLTSPPLTAELALEKLTKHYEVKPSSPVKDRQPFPGQEPWMLERRQAAMALLNKTKDGHRKDFEKAKPHIHACQEAIAQFRKTGELTDDFYKSCLYYAKLEGAARMLKISPTFKDIDPKDVQDLKALIGCLPGKMTQVNNRIVLNPNLPILPVAAEGDLILDDMLIDIKTVEKAALSRKVFNQLIGYYTGYLLSDKYQEHPVTKLGIYFSRHGYLWTIDVATIGSNETLLAFGKWLSTYSLIHNPAKADASTQVYNF
jgi:hypothetical protein